MNRKERFVHLGHQKLVGLLNNGARNLAGCQVFLRGSGQTFGGAKNCGNHTLKIVSNVWLVERSGGKRLVLF